MGGCIKTNRPFVMKHKIGRKNKKSGYAKMVREFTDNHDLRIHINKCSNTVEIIATEKK